MSSLSVRPTTNLTNQVIIKSVLLHVGILLFFTVNTYLFPSEDLKFENAIRVDIVGLPEKLKHLPEPTKAKETAKPTPAKIPDAPTAPAEKVAPAPEKTVDKKAAELERKKAQAKALEKLKAMEALSELEKEDEQESKSKQGAVAGNIVSEGNALTGIRQNQISSYIGLVKDHVNKNWNLPQWMASAKLRAEAMVMIDSRGVVTKRIITKGSGNSNFDDTILNAIDQSSPFPAPPPALVGVFKNKGFTLGFPE